MAQLRNVCLLDNGKGTVETYLSFLFTFSNAARILKSLSNKDAGLSPPVVVSFSERLIKLSRRKEKRQE